MFRSLQFVPIPLKKALAIEFIGFSRPAQNTTKTGIRNKKTLDRGQEFQVSQ
jgi:hypothetical protein